MNRKALFTGAMALLVMFAVLPAANATVLDPLGCPAGNSTAILKLYKEYNTTYHTCMNTPGLIPASLVKKYNVSYSGIFNVLKNKPDSKLTWGEAYFLAETYSNEQNSGSKNHIVLDKYTLKYYQNTLHYANLMIQKENTAQSRALAYLTMSNAADSINTITGNPLWLQKELYFGIKFIENDPDGIVNDGTYDWENDSQLNSFSSPIVLLRRAGYTVPHVALSFPWKASVAANAGKIHTIEDLNRLGFEQWKQNYITPLISEKAPLPRRIAENIPVIKNNPELVNLLSSHGYIFLIVFGILGFFIIGIRVLRRNSH